MEDIDVLKVEVYEPLGRLLRRGGDRAFIEEGPALLQAFYHENPHVIRGLRTKPAQDGQYTRGKLIVEGERMHAIRFMEWPKGSKAPIHEHGGRPCFDIVTEGLLIVTDLMPVEQGNCEYMLGWIKSYAATPGDLIIIDPRTGCEVHSVTAKENSKSLHIYPIDHRSIGIYVPNENGTFTRKEHPLPDD